MRAVEKFLPWTRDIILVTNGQFPAWSKTKATHYRLVTHDQEPTWMAF